MEYPNILEDYMRLVEQVPCFENGVDILAQLPSNYLYPPEQRIIGRKNELDVAVENWEGIYDPVYPAFHQKQEHIKRYFFLELTTVGSNPQDTISIAAGVNSVSVKSVEVTSSFKLVAENTQEISVALNMQSESKTPASSSKIALEVESTFTQRNLREQSNTRINREETRIEIASKDINRLFVPWAAIRGLALYRQLKNENVELVAFSQWADEVIDTVYEYNINR